MTQIKSEYDKESNF